ncbi:hypothetical protein JQM64_10990 [Fournierella massiliensis]|nr:hypothetical protein [Fournierella massiliensis]MCF2558035.1 hypothetical protein [Fournierella massiliensis]
MSLFHTSLDPKDAPPAAKALYNRVKDKPLHNDAILNAVPIFYTDWHHRSFVKLLDYLTQMGYTHTLTPEDCLQAQIQKKQLVRFGPFWYQPGDLVSEMKARLKVYAIAAPIVILLAYLFAALNG